MLSYPHITMIYCLRDKNIFVHFGLVSGARGWWWLVLSAIFWKCLGLVFNLWILFFHVLLQLQLWCCWSVGFIITSVTYICHRYWMHQSKIEWFDSGEIILKKQDINAIIELAWADDVPFEAIFKQYGVTESQCISIMRKELKPSSFKLWRKRVTGRKAKHSRLWMNFKIWCLYSVVLGKNVITWILFFEWFDLFLSHIKHFFSLVECHSKF